MGATINAAHSIAFSQDGQMTAVSMRTGEILFWNLVDDQRLKQTLPDQTHSEIAFSPDDTRLASGSKDFTVRLWNTETGSCISGSLQGNIYHVPTVVFSPNDQWIASASKDNTISIWDAHSGQPIAGPLEKHQG